jgi:hypothetical protein
MSRVRFDELGTRSLECLCDLYDLKGRGAGTNMRITIEHKRTKAEVIESIDRSFDQMFQGVSGLPVRIVVEQKSWQGSLLSFALSAQMGGFSTPIKGTVEVTDNEVTVDADLGMLGRFVPEDATRELIGKRIKGLLN